MSRFTILREDDPEADPFDRQRRIQWWRQEALTDARVMVLGAGAIGNEVLKNLALLGVGYLFVADFDEVSRSNLSRTVLFRAADVGQRKAEVAAQRVREMCVHPGAQVDWYHGDVVWELGAGVFRRMDLVLGCLDNVETRYAVNRLCWLTGTPWIDAGIFELGARVNVYVPPEPPCHECGATAEQLKAVRQRYACDDFRRRAQESGRVATVQIASALVGAIQAQEAVKLLCGRKAAVGAQIYYQGAVPDFDVMPLPANPACQAHVTFPEVVPLPLGAGDTLRAFLDHVSDPSLAGPGAALELWDRAFVTDFPCRGCANPVRLDRPPFRVFDDEAYCEACRAGHPPAPAAELFPGEKLSRFSLEETPARLLDLSLGALGVPPLHVVLVRDAQDGFRYYELSADEEALLPGLRRRPGAGTDDPAVTGEEAGLAAAAESGTPGLAPVA